MEFALCNPFASRVGPISLVLSPADLFSTQDTFMRKGHQRPSWQIFKSLFWNDLALTARAGARHTPCVGRS